MVESKIKTDIYLLSGSTGAIFAPDNAFQANIYMWNHLQCILQERIQFQIKIFFYDINHYLMTEIIQIVHNITPIIPQIIHVMRRKVL